MHPEEQIFNFWVEYFDDACKEETKDFIRFPVSRKQTFEGFIYRARYVVGRKLVTLVWLTLILGFAQPT